MISHSAQERKEEYVERLQAIFQEGSGEALTLYSAVKDLFHEFAADYSRTIEALRRENAMLLGGLGDYLGQHPDACTEALAQIQVYAEELVVANEELRLTNEELNAARKIAEEERERYYDLFDTAPEGYLVTDRSGTILEANNAVATLLAIHKDSLQGRNILHFAPEEQLPEIRARMTQARMTRAARMKHKQSFESELRPVMEEPVCVSMSVVGVRTGEGGDVSLHWMVQDISERKQVEKDLQRHTEELARLNQELASAHREANLYLDILTHDIRNTENVSNLYAELLADKLQGEAAQYMENLQQSIRKSIEILSMVSTIRRVHRAKSILKPVGLEAVIREAGRNVESTSFHYQGTGTHSQVWADDLLLVVFNNLIGNAVKHGGPNVRIFVRVEEEEGGMLISVEDTGPGVPDEAKEEIFRVYETQKRGVGEGLGLYLAQVLVERYGGRIWVEDRVPGRSGEGAAFRLTLRKVA